ncbi:hypothetical protein [Chromatium okenii]|uniref:Uncharacterized protein n=1 Tax=Chromatium okenii TaxID=61644 RepID=A0A2S7XQX8_9GAMM|nr:hypothetical protein [Chromatium okenii]PQJ96137.1 hypothetical protein CXB77_10030 [Chromatium okenii]
MRAATTNTIGLSGNYQPNGAALTTSTSLTTGKLAYTPVSLATVATDTLTIAVDNGGTANTGTYTAGAITATNVESLTLTTADWTAVTLGGITQTVATTAAASMTASGASNLTLGTILDVASLSDTTGVDTYNFGGVAGTLSATIAANGSVSVTGAAGIDTITASADMTRSTSARTQTYNLAMAMTASPSSREILGWALMSPISWCSMARRVTINSAMPPRLPTPISI